MVVCVLLMRRVGRVPWGLLLLMLMLMLHVFVLWRESLVFG